MPTKKEFTLEHNKDQLLEELMVAHQAKPASKDILIVVRDQKEYLKKCLESVLKYTCPPFHIYLWDNGSKNETADYILEMDEKYKEITSTRVEHNLGFIYPNNRLAELGTGEYLVLLNSDTVVRKEWDKAMIGWLQTHPDTAEVGYLGGWLSKEGMGFNWGFGDKVDYICGWALCIARETYNKFGLFDEENLVFAYAEDSDLSLRLIDAGYKIYALHVDLVVHYENKTINNVKQERNIQDSFDKNHAYIKSRWEKYLNK